VRTVWIDNQGIVAMIGAGCPHFRTVIPLALVCALSCVTDAVAQDKSGAIIPYKATYKIEVSSLRGKKLKSVWPPRPVGDGSETIELRQTCHGWRYRETVSTTMTSGARPAVSKYTVTWFEGSDGRRFTFEERRDDGAKTEKTTATASIARGGKNEAVIVDKGKRRTMTLPDGTIFPMTFLRRILSAARNGDDSVSALVFNGRFHKQLGRTEYRIERADKPGLDRLPNDLKASKAWRLERAYYRAPSGISDNTLFVDTRAGNGVLLKRDYYYRDIEVHWLLRSASKLPRPKCR
jgi:hypothetical protein